MIHVEGSVRWKIGSISESRAGSPRFVQAQLGQIVEPHIAWGYFITEERQRRKKKKEDGSRAILTFTTADPRPTKSFSKKNHVLKLKLTCLSQVGIPTCERGIYGTVNFS